MTGRYRSGVVGETSSTNTRGTQAGVRGVSGKRGGVGLNTDLVFRLVR